MPQIFSILGTGLNAGWQSNIVWGGGNVKNSGTRRVLKFSVSSSRHSQGGDRQQWHFFDNLNES